MTDLLHLDAGDPSSLEDLLDQAAKDLADNMNTGYTDGYERTLAEKVLARYIGPDALHELVANHLERLIGVDCLLDQADDASYVVVDQMAQTLLAGIRAQGGEQDAVLRLAMSEVVEREDLDRRLGLNGAGA
jgi:hypothetical protein